MASRPACDCFERLVYLWPLRPVDPGSRSDFRPVRIRVWRRIRLLLLLLRTGKMAVCGPWVLRRLSGLATERDLSGHLLSCRVGKNL